MKSSYERRSEKILKMKYALSTFTYDFILRPLKSGAAGFLAVFFIITALKIFKIIDPGPSILSLKEFHFSLAGFFVGYAIRLIKNIEK